MLLLQPMLQSLKRGAPGEWYRADLNNKVNWHDQSQVKRRLYNAFNQSQSIYLQAMLSKQVPTGTAMSALMQLNYFNTIHRALYLRYCTPPIMMSYQIRRFYHFTYSNGIWDKIFAYLNAYENISPYSKDPVVTTNSNNTNNE
jgi:hypothetical protein